MAGDDMPELLQKNFFVLLCVYLKRAAGPDTPRNVFAKSAANAATKGYSIRGPEARKNSGSPIGKSLKYGIPITMAKAAGEAKQRRCLGA
jgi:hypothetical protein